MNDVEQTHEFVKKKDDKRAAYSKRQKKDHHADKNIKTPPKVIRKIDRHARKRREIDHQKT